MTIDEIQLMLDGRGKKYTAEKVAQSVQKYGDAIPGWYAELWTSAAIFEADMYVHDSAVDDEPSARIKMLRLDGPDDGWKKDDQVALVQAGYFSLGTWDSGADWLIAPSRSTELGAPVRTIDHEVAGDVDEITPIEGIETFQDVLDSVVDWPILRAVDKWRKCTEREQSEPDPLESLRGLSGAEMVAKLRDMQRTQGANAEENLNYSSVVRALTSGFSGGAKADEEDCALPEKLGQLILAKERERQRQWDAAGIGPLPHYREEELPDALLYAWDHVESESLRLPKLQRGAELLRSLSAAVEQRIPRHLLVVGQDDGQFIAMDLTRPGAFGDCPVIAWPAEQELAPSLGDWLLRQ